MNKLYKHNFGTTIKETQEIDCCDETIEKIVVGSVSRDKHNKDWLGAIKKYRGFGKSQFTIDLHFVL